MMNQTKKIEQGQPRPQNTTRRPKRCMICRKMFAFQKYNQHAETCSKLEQKRIEDSRMRQRNIRNSTLNKNNNLPKKQEGAMEQQGNRFRIKSLAQNTHGKSKSVLVNKKPQIKQEVRRSQLIQQPPPTAEIKVQKRQGQQSLIPNESVTSNQFVEQDVDPPRQPEVPVRNTVNNPISRPTGNASNIEQDRVQRREEVARPIRTQPQTLIEQSSQRIAPRQQQSGYDFQALVDNSNSIVEFIRSVNLLGDQTMNDMVSQLQQLSLIAQQIAHLNSIGHPFGSSMANLFAVRLHEMQTVITNQIGIALIRSFNERLGSQFQLLMQGRPQIREGFSESEIEQTFPQRINWNRKECSICLQDMKPSELIIELQCYHIFHPPCIKEWLVSSRKCPMCRKVQEEVK